MELHTAHELIENLDSLPLFAIHNRTFPDLDFLDEAVQDFSVQIIKKGLFSDKVMRRVAKRYHGYIFATLTDNTFVLSVFLGLTGKKNK